MVNIKRKTDKILAILLIAILAGVGTSVFAMTSQRVSVSADTYADDTNYVNYERHIATIDDDFASNRVIVTLKPGYSDVNKSFSTQNLRTSDNTIIESVKDLTRMENPSKITNRASFTQILSIELRQDSKEGVLRAIEELEQLDMVLAAEPDYYLESEDLWQPPDDTGFNQQWGLGAAPGIRAQQAWTMTTGETNPRINVGIFETGLDANHNDLRVITGNVGSTDPTHGTFVGGVIGAITHNNRGVAGIAQVNLAQLDRGNGGNLNNNNQGVFPQSLVWAIDNDIRIVNCSFRFALNGAIMRQPIVAHREAIRVFGENGGLLVAAAGNDTEDIDVTRTFPAAYGDARDFPEITNVITVGSIDSDGGLSSFSNWGANSVHIYAPGRNILSTIPTGSTPAGYRRHSDGYAYGDGTSFAAPHVSGVAALMLSVNPDFTPQDLRNNLINSGDVVTLTTPDTSFWPWQNNSITFTSRRLNAEAALAPFTTSTYGLLSNQISITGVISGATLPANLVIPANLNGRTVTSIENGAFYGCTGLTSVTIPNGVKSIGNGAFYGCTGLTSVTIPNGVTSIGDSAFSGTTADIYSSLYKISFPSSTQISIDGVKPGVTLAGDLVIPTSLHGRTVTGIGASAFANKTGITSILIHDNVTSIASDAFSGTTADIYSSLYKISFPSSTQISIDGVRPGITLPSNLVIPNFINGRTVTTIGNEAFAAHSGLTGITIPNTVTKIGDWAFAFCSGLTSITIPGSVTTIGQAVFLSCYSLAGVTIPNSVTSIGQSAFLGCGSLTSITIPSSVTKIEDDAFSFCNNLTTVYIERPSSWGITTLGNSVFAFSPLAVIYVPDTASVTAYKAAANWSYYSALIDKPFVPTPGLAYTYILSSNSYAVSKGAANTNGVVYIPARYNGLPVTEIAQSGFSNCTNLTGVVFEAGSFLHTVGNEAFLLCSGLTSITLPNSVTNIEGSAFIFSGLTSITIPGKVTTIKKDAFRWCNSLASITIPNSVTSIEQGALYGCRSLTSITIPSGVTEIADWAFAYCIGVTSITIPNGVTSIGNGAFGGCNGLTSIAIPNGVTSIGDFAFGECVDLTSVTIPNSVVSIGDQAFAFCLKLTSITIPSSVASLRYMAFAFCSNLATVYIERPSVLGITTLDSEAFLCSPNLAAIYVPDAASVSVYQGANGWSTYANRIYPL